MKQNQKLKRELSSVHLLFLSFSAIFGSGWLFAPLFAAKVSGPGSLLAWALAGGISCVIGLTMAEVITLYPKSGGLNQAAAETHGEFLGLTVTFLNLVVFLILPALEVRAILQYLSSYSNSFMGANDVFTPLGFLVSVLLLAGIFLFNLLGARMTGKANSLLVIFKIVTPLVISGAFLFELFHKGKLNHQNFAVPVSGSEPFDLGAVFTAIATCGIMFSYNGFNQATVFAGEAQEPKKSIPFAILGSIFLAGILYFLVQYVFLVAVPPEALQHGWAALSFPGEQGPFAGLAKGLGLSSLLVLVYLDAFFSPAGTAFSYSSAAPRLFYSLAESSGGFRFLQILNKRGAPIVAILISFLFEIAALYFLPNLKAMIGILVAAFVTCYTVVPASLLFLRKAKPDLARPFRVPFAPAFAFLSLFLSNLMVFSCGWDSLRNLVCACGVVWVLCFLIEKRKAQPTLKILQGSTWFIAQVLGTCLLGYLKKNHGLSFLTATPAIAAMSLTLLLFALKTGKEDAMSP